MNKEEQELQKVRKEFLDYMWDTLTKYRDKLSIPEVTAIHTLFNFIYIVKHNLELMDELDQKHNIKGDQER